MLINASLKENKQLVELNSLLEKIITANGRPKLDDPNYEERLKLLESNVPHNFAHLNGISDSVAALAPLLRKYVENTNKDVSDVIEDVDKSDKIIKACFEKLFKGAEV